MGGLEISHVDKVSIISAPEEWENDLKNYVQKKTLACLSSLWTPLLKIETMKSSEHLSNKLEYLYKVLSCPVRF